MNNIKINYSTTLNLGDRLNVLIGDRILGVHFIHCNRFLCESTGIGSGLGRFFVRKSILNHTVKGRTAKLIGQLTPPLRVWSAGFIEYPKEKEISLRPKVNVASVRGELTKKRLESILDKKLDITVGDGGLLAACLLNEKVEKKYSIGIIPHLREKGLPIFDNFITQNNKSIVIDVTDDPLKVLALISSCEYILSSSLHGLIVADSFNIPNQRIIVSDKLVGDGYKFDDYYSSFGIIGNVIRLNEHSKITPNNIIDNYKISSQKVEQKKEEIIKAFHLFI